ncbi:MAG: 4-amino-4-deoxy-L-arabinose transferase-like glycosyltransferase [Planctomycetota bacterium]|jgi:4-amino-4-deoxy-L-arabinose transferase-like glycosyltransferase
MERPTRVSWKWLIGIFLIAWLPRHLTVVQYEAEHPMAGYPVIDEAAYDDWAMRLASGDWLGDEVFFQEPLYAYSLGVIYAVCGHSPPIVRRLQAILGALTAALVALLAAELFGRVTAHIAGIAFALYSPAWLFCALLLKPVAVMFVLVMLAWLLVRTIRQPSAWLWSVAGALAACGALLRGNVLVMLPFLCAWPLGRWLIERLRLRMGRQAGARAGAQAEGTVAFASHSLTAMLRACLCIAAGVTLVLAPVFIRNRVVGGEFVLTTSGAGTNLYGGNNASNPHGVATEFDWVRGVPEHEAADWRREAERRVGEKLAAEQVSHYWMGQVLESIARDPALHARILWNKLQLALNAHEVADNHHLAWDARYVAMLRSWPVGFGLWGGLGLAGLAVFGLLPLVRPGGRASKKSVPAGLHSADGTLDLCEQAACEVALLWLLYLGTIVLTVMSMRIRLAIVPLMLPFACAFLLRLWNARRTKGDLLPNLAALVICIGLVHWPVFDDALRAAEFDERDYNLAVQFVESDRLDEAHALARELSGKHPGTQRLETLLAQIALLEVRSESRMAIGHNSRRSVVLEQAYVRVRSPRASSRESFRAHAIAGLIALERGLPATAVDHFARARAFDPDDPELVLGELRARLSLESSNGEGPSLTTLDDLIAFHQLYQEERHRPVIAERAQLLLAEVLFAIGAAELGALPTGSKLKDEQRVRAQGRIQDALMFLRPLTESMDPAAIAAGTSLAARMAAARMQLDPLLTSWAAAANHARNAVALGGGAPAKFLLARALAHDGADDASREELSEALEILGGLDEANRSSEVQSLRDYVEGELQP